MVLSASLETTQKVTAGASSGAFTFGPQTCRAVPLVLRSEGKEQNKLSFVLILMEMSDVYTKRESLESILAVVQRSSLKLWLHVALSRIQFSVCILKTVALFPRVWRVFLSLQAVRATLAWQ